MAYRCGRTMGEKAYEAHFTTVQIRKKDFARLQKICFQGEAKWKGLKRLIDAHEVALLKKVKNE